MQALTSQSKPVTIQSRLELLSFLSETIEAVKRPHPVRIAIDGVDGSGKTTLADELAAFFQSSSRPIIRASIDDFHKPRAERYQRGSLSPEGYFHDSFNYDAVVHQLLRPFGSEGDRLYQSEAFDHRLDLPKQSAPKLAPADAILLFDGVFLLRPELRSFWDLSIFVEVPFSVSMDRAIKRDSATSGSEPMIRERYEQRYVPGQQLYLNRCRPLEYADIVVDNSVPEAPRVRRRNISTRI